MNDLKPGVYPGSEINPISQRLPFEPTLQTQKTVHYPIPLYIAFAGFLFSKGPASVPVQPPNNALSPNQAELKLDSNLSTYFKYANLAARDLYANDFITASCDYETAFKHKVNPFYTDVKNAILANIKSGSTAKNLPLLNKLMVEKHMDTAQLFIDLPLRIFDPNNRNYILQLQTKTAAKNKTQSKLAAGLSRIYLQEQQLLEADIRGVELNPFARDSLQKAKAKQHTQNVLEFLQLCKEKGFPTEERVGVYYEQGTSWAEVLYALCSAFMLTDQKEKLFELLETACRTGDLHPSQYASLMDRAFQNSGRRIKELNFMNTPVVLCNGKAYRPFIYYSDSLMREVNTNRVSIGLDSFHIVQKQVACVYLYQKYHAAKMEGKRIIRMEGYASMDAMDFGFVKWAFEQEKQDITKYELNVKRILDECNCAEKVY